MVQVNIRILGWNQDTFRLPTRDQVQSLATGRTNACIFSNFVVAAKNGDLVHVSDLDLDSPEGMRTGFGVEIRRRNLAESPAFQHAGRH